VTAAVGMQDRFEREFLSGTPGGMGRDELEIAVGTAGEKASNLLDMRLCVPLEFRQHVGVAGRGKSRDFFEDGFLEALERRFMLSVERRTRRGDDPDCLQGREGLAQRGAGFELRHRKM